MRTVNERAKFTSVQAESHRYFLGGHGELLEEVGQHSQPEHVHGIYLNRKLPGRSRVSEGLGS